MKKLILALAVASLSGCMSTTPTLEGNPSTTNAVAPTPFVVPTVAKSGAKFTLPAYEQMELDNGLTVYLLQRDTVPLITVNAVVRAGAVNDAEPGTAKLTSQAMLLGTSSLSKNKLESTVENLGASLNASAGKEGTSLHSQFQSKDLQVMLPLIAEVLTKPSFPADEVMKARDRYVAQLSQQKESPRQVINNYFDRLLYGNHPYGNAAVGNADAIAQLDEFDLKIFHGSWYQPRNTALVIAGDFNRADVLALVKQQFGQWADRKTPTPPNLEVAVAQPSSARVLLVDKADARETTFLIGGPGVARDNPDYVGLQVLNTILGGRFTSWLNDELRVNAGLTYGARSHFNALGEHGGFTISTFTATETTAAAMDLALKTYTRLWEQGIDQATLDSAKAYVKGQFPPKYETADQLAGLLGQMHLMKMDPKQLDNFSQQVDKLTVADAQQLVAKHFPKDNLQFVLVGKADDIRGLAANYGDVTEVSINQAGFRF
ncbi:M16 family metallopeptidase [Ferrimonas lipolytica]|uniref:Insulinase family protein n=1 Tax=Ferrimonas lipolytica TaxID=2724191 RepID=A0A6H1UGI1_9GAMM|nr:pitrilysin family protein [Ferrimonas lipolytica]QIZ78154.1 insulinase family protein [Ferrimonas lipolytica]